MNFFIIGMRRSGTSILRKLLLKHPDISGIEFEPHPLWNAVDILHFPRFENNGTYGDYYRHAQEIVTRFDIMGTKKNYGAKFALNPGTKALEWKWLFKTFPEAKFVFIARSSVDNFNSFKKQDAKSFRGMLDNHSNFNQWHDKLNNEFLDFCYENPRNGKYVRFKDLIRDPDFSIAKIFGMLGCDFPKLNLKQYIKQPEFAQKQVTA